ncbi:MAG: glycosyltransferase family 2 protein [Bacteroidia bacterium]
MTRIAVIVPAYNEEQALAAVVQSIKLIALQEKLDLEVIVVNDCSTDGTAGVMDTLPCIAIHLPVNLGIGGAMQTGFKYALENGFDFAVQMDGDGQHPATDLPLLIKKQKQSGSDVVIGSRFINKQGYQSSAIRRMGINYFSRLNKILLGIELSDCTSGFRLLNSKALVLAAESYPDEYPEPESLVYFSRNKLRITEVAVSMLERQGGVSSIGRRDSVYYMIKVSLAIFFTYIRNTPNHKS